MRHFIKKIVSPFLQKASALYLSKPRKYSYKHISVWVEPTVFPPFITISTKLLLEFTDTLSLKNKSFLELGCGCGIISILAAQKEAKVTASDINQIALNALTKNATLNKVTIEILYSDLFENLENKQFDVIVINPPYYPKNPISIAENAWFCGENFEYFEKLFFQIAKHITIENETYMILSEDCDLKNIKLIASKTQIRLELVVEKKVVSEKNYIFKLNKI